MEKVDISRQELIEKISKEFKNGKGAEIGVFKGEFSKEILEVWDGILYMIDVWRPLGDEYNDISNHKIHTNVYSEAMNNINGYEDRAIMIRSKSESASEIFKDEFFDFVYIDANHAYNFVVDDIKYWYSKVKVGGYLMGHDYVDMDWYNDPNFAENKKDKFLWVDGVYIGLFGVNPAVDEFCQKNSYDANVTNEWCGSWFLKKV